MYVGDVGNGTMFTVAGDKSGPCNQTTATRIVMQNGQPVEIMCNHTDTYTTFQHQMRFVEYQNETLHNNTDVVEQVDNRTQRLFMSCDACPA